MRNANMKSAFGVVMAVLLWTQPSAAQLPGASPATLGTAGNYMALARGFAAIGLNPAGLGLPGNEGLTVALLPVQLRNSLNPLTFSDIFDYDGILVPASVREDWLQRIEAAGGQTGAGIVDLTAVSFSFGHFGAQVSTIASGYTNLNEGAAELLFFGNAGRTGTARDLDLEGSGVSGFAATTVAVSYGLPIARRWAPGVDQGLSIGVTIKQTWGHGLVFADDAGSRANSAPLSVDLDFPSVYPSEGGGNWDKGSGLGVDVGVAWERDSWTASAVAKNIVNGFKWDQAEHTYRQNQATFSDQFNISVTEEQPAFLAPPAVRQKVRDLTFKPSFALGGAYEAQENLTVTAEFRQRIGDGLETGPKTHIGMGMEFRPSPLVPLRAGFAAITDGFQAGGGLGVILGPIHLGVAGLFQMGDVGDGWAGTIGLSYGGG